MLVSRPRRLVAVADGASRGGRLGETAEAVPGVGGGAGAVGHGGAVPVAVVTDGGHGRCRRAGVGNPGRAVGGVDAVGDASSLGHSCAVPTVLLDAGAVSGSVVAVGGGP